MHKLLHMYHKRKSNLVTDPTKNFGIVGPPLCFTSHWHAKTVPSSLHAMLVSAQGGTSGEVVFVSNGYFFNYPASPRIWDMLLAQDG